MVLFTNQRDQFFEVISTSNIIKGLLQPPLTYDHGCCSMMFFLESLLKSFVFPMPWK